MIGTPTSYSVVPGLTDDSIHTCISHYLFLNIASYSTDSHLRASCPAVLEGILLWRMSGMHMRPLHLRHANSRTLYPDRHNEPQRPWRTFPTRTR